MRERILLQQFIIILIIILSISTALMIYLSNFMAVALDQDLYEDEFEKYGIQDRFNSSVDLSAETEILITYLDEGKGDISSDFYNEKEKTHLVEVRSLFRTTERLINITVVISILSVILLIASVRKHSSYLSHDYRVDYFKKTISNMLIGIGAIVDGIGIAFIAMAFTFSTAFFKFHELFFKSDTWLLNPETDNLIRMFPEMIFFDMFTRIILMSIVLATILLVIGFIMKLNRLENLRNQHMWRR